MESNGMKNLKIIIGDPAKAGDSFGVLGQHATWPEKKIFTRLAKEFKREPYPKVAKYFTKLKKQIRPDLMIIEKNFDYENVSKAFSKLGITYVSTTTGLTEKARAKGWAVDKNFMIGWMKQEYKRHTIQLPENQSDGMRELINQRNQIVGITAPSGHTAYKAQRGRHDDLFMCELIGCNAIRIWWDQLDAAH